MSNVLNNCISEIVNSIAEKRHIKTYYERKEFRQCENNKHVFWRKRNNSNRVEKMVIEIKSIGCIEDLKKVPAKLGFSKGMRMMCSFYFFPRLFFECNIIDVTCLHFQMNISDDNWLNVVCYSLSTKSGTLAFAHQRKIIVLSNQWDTKLQQFKYSIVWSGELECATDDEVTAIACLTVTNEQNEVSDCDKSVRAKNLYFVCVFF